MSDCIIRLLLAVIILFSIHARHEVAAKTARAELLDQPCRIDGLQGYKEALLRHDLARRAFRTKFRTGYYARPGVLSADLLHQTPEALLDETAKAIVTIADKRTVLLLYDIGTKTETPRKLCIWLIGADGLIASAEMVLPPPPMAFLAREIFRVNSRAASRIPALRNSARNAAPDTDLSEADMLPVNGLSETLIPAPIRARLMDADTDRILILPVADLGAVPWAALPLGRKMLVDKAAPVVLADIDWILQPPPPFEASRGGLIIGDPDLSEDKKWRFTPLPAAREEAEIVAQHLSASLLLGAEANHRSVMAELSQPWGGLIYFATHGLADPVNPMDGSFLALKDEHLYARDIKKLVLLQRPLIVMSACQTGLGKVFNAGVFGLSRAWWQAGASQIVMSLWNVDDAATRDLMTDFIGQIAGNDDEPATISREQALRQAMLNARDRDPDPALWAGFALFGLPTPSSSQ